MNWNRFVMHLIIASMILPPGMQVAVAQESQNLPSSPIPEGSVQYELYESNMNRMTKFMIDIRSHLNRTTFDFDALLDSLNYDADEIIEFSKSEIAFEQYPGVLRGPLGTLFSRAGNSIDQSLFLARLLRDAGYDARIVGTELDVDQARTVIRAMKRPIVSAPPIGDADEFLGEMERHKVLESEISEEHRAAYRQFVSTPLEASTSGIYESVIDMSDFVMAQLESDGAVMENEAVQVKMLEESRQYHWVQYKDNAADPWTGVQPVFAGDSPFTNLSASTFISSEVPKELQHRLRFQVFIERKIGDRLEVVPVTSPWERPVANLVGTPLTISNMADSMFSEEALRTDIEDLLNSANSFVPSFGNGMASGARFFNYRGTIIDPLAATDAAAGLFATINGAFGDAIGQIGDKNSIPTLTAQWLEFALIAPDGTEQVFRRTTFDRIGLSARQQGNLPPDLEQTVPSDARSLLQRHTFMVGVGKIPRGFIVESAVNRFQSARPSVDAVVDISLDRPPKPRSLSEVPVGWAGFTALYSIIDMADSIGPHHRSYRSGPALVVHSDGLGRDQKTIEAIDVVSNPRRSVDVQLDDPSLDPKYALQAGVWETAVEGALLSETGRFNTWSAFESAERDGVKPVVFVPGQVGKISGVSADTAAAIDIDLASGFAVVLPGTGDSAWWRVNMQTGETLGRIGDGRGGDLAERVITTMIGFASIIYGMSQCEGLRGNAQTCCMVANAGMSAMGVGVGLGLAGKLGVLTTAVWELDFSVLMPTAGICEALTR